MIRLKMAIAFAAGLAVGTFAIAVASANAFFRTCENLDDGGGFMCSHCGSHTEYRPKTPFRVCPICGAYVIKTDREV